jgi:hypothetical protein
LITVPYPSTTDQDPALCFSGFKDGNKNKFFTMLFGLLLTVGTITPVLKEQVIKKSQNWRNKSFQFLNF